jgi:hypothetical protein
MVMLPTFFLLLRASLASLPAANQRGAKRHRFITAWLAYVRGESVAPKTHRDPVDPKETQAGCGGAMEMVGTGEKGG